ncbi:hypothetical protein WJX72_011422 [[Myrmecia] bisecta]|uniref:Uncharacterized protein n=1 Tax=[Myrmecia] bisecta TaxID=41462 RepID=A0AAW1P078_9CHLO
MPAVYGVLAEKGAELLVVNPGSNKLCIGLANSQLPMGDDIVAELQRLEALMQPLDKAIVQAMAPFDDVELRKRMFTNILVIGAGSAIPGLADMVEARVLHDIPDHDAVDTVNVVLPKSSAPAAVWQGGALLGALDSRHNPHTEAAAKAAATGAESYTRQLCSRCVAQHICEDSLSQC